MPYPGRNNIYEATIKRMTNEALEAQEQDFYNAHASDSEEQFLTYLRQCAVSLGHTPWPREIVGGCYIERRFGDWKTALLKANLPRPSAPDNLSSFARIQDERARQELAYHKVYLEKARNNLGRMLDFATYDLGYDPCTFFNLFMNSGLAKRFEKGEFNVTVGMSGVELARRVLELTKYQIEDPQPRYSADRSPEYWAGWALAYYQWETAMSFLDILECVPLDDIIRMYSPYHEMDIRHFCDRMNELYRATNPETKLKQLRQRARMSQSELAEQSGVPVRTIQQYEQRQKSINKAQAEYLMMLANALHCKAEDLIEPVE